MLAITFAAQAFASLQLELLLFAAVLFALGTIDEFLVDVIYVWQRLTGKIVTAQVDEGQVEEPALEGQAAVFIPAWQEAEVIGATLSHALSVWPQADLRIFVGVYRNDVATQAAIQNTIGTEPRLRVVTLDHDGPTSKAHCLNHLYRALRDEENRDCIRYRMVVLHDAEDMVDPKGLTLLDRAMSKHVFVQLPVFALPHPASRLVAGHYCDEFAEAHAKTLPVRASLGCAIPGAGVGSAISRGALEKLAREMNGFPFAESSLTEDYDLGIRVHQSGGRSQFLRARTADGRLIATRAYFPARLGAAIRQKTRWTHGIALQSWDTLGWTGSLLDRWMMMRDRRSPLAALVVAIAYLLVLSGLVTTLVAYFGVAPFPKWPPSLEWLLWLTMGGLVWRSLVRAVFTTRDHGWREGLMSIPRAIVSNVIAIVSTWRAMSAYARVLRGGPVTWDKTEHRDHPVNTNWEGSR